MKLEEGITLLSVAISTKGLEVPSSLYVSE